MSNPDEATKIPNDKTPGGKPLEPGAVVEEEFEEEGPAGDNDPASGKQTREEAGMRS